MVAKVFSSVQKKHAIIYCNLCVNPGAAEVRNLRQAKYLPKANSFYTT